MTRWIFGDCLHAMELSNDVADANLAAMAAAKHGDRVGVRIATFRRRLAMLRCALHDIEHKARYEIRRALDLSHPTSAR